MTPKRLYDDFIALRSGDTGSSKILNKLNSLEKNLTNYLDPWYQASRENHEVYPSQGLLFTPYDHLGSFTTHMLPQHLILETLRMRTYFLEMFNHPYRIANLIKVNKTSFVPPVSVSSNTLDSAIENGLALSIGDIGARVVGSQHHRVSRNELYGQGPFIKLGRQARTIFVGSASPDVWNSAHAISTMAASHSLAAIPRNGVTSSVDRQVDLAKEVFTKLKELSLWLLPDRPDRAEILKLWQKNVMGVVEANPEKVGLRAKKLYDVGVRSFRVYSPEPGTGPVDTVKKLRSLFGQTVEIFSGQVVDVIQAKQVQAAGADGIFVGIGGGGRCITGVRSGSAIDWPELVWKLRGELSIPVIVEGGASDHIAVTLLLGASGIGVSRVVSGGTIESPGGVLYCADNSGKLFKPYGGEASARTKYLDGKMQPFGIPSFVEGETSKAEISYVKHIRPTLTYNLHTLIEDSILALVFRGVENFTQLHALNPSPLCQITSSGEFQRNTH